MNVIVVDYGVRDGVKMMRINGKMDDVRSYVNELEEEGYTLVNEPSIEPIRLNQYTTFLQVRKSKEKVCAGEL